ncbi:MAG: pantoate--beta-alanine ligase [Phototrophicales bacterium]|nr:MAG: pantoate--beta-alanine ligase [Phototrophicales bacterium]
MRIIDDISDLRVWRRSVKGTVGVVPTMGALHAGHLRLVEAARAENDYVLVTIFVNPTQFTANEDFERYPRNLAGDLGLLEAEGVDCAFTPTPEIMYPPGFQTAVTVETVSQGLEGERRPGHFRGVATVVAKLFNLTQPDTAYFGQKDAQQVVVVRRMVRDLDFPIEIAVIPTVRESDGLALSSRNTYLTPAQRADAASIYRGLCAAADRYDSGERRPEALADVVQRSITGGEVDYISLNHPGDLSPITELTDAPMLLSLTVRYGSTRLLDNLLLPAKLNTREGLTAHLGAPTP